MAQNVQRVLRDAFARVQELEAQLSDAQVLYRKKEAQLRQKKEKNEELKKELLRMHRQNKQLQNQMGDIESSLNGQIQTLKASQTEQQREFASVEEAKRSFSDKLQMLYDELAKKEAEIAERQSFIDKQDRELRELRDFKQLKTEAYDSVLEEKYRTDEELSVERKRFEAETAELRREQQERETAMMQEMEEVRANYEEQVNKIQHDLEVSRSANAEEIRRMRDAFDEDMKENINAVAKERDAIISSLEVELKRARQDTVGEDQISRSLRMLREELSVKDQLNAAQEESMQHLRSEIHGLEANLSKANARTAAGLSQEESELISSLKEDIAALEEQVAAKDEIIELLKTRIVSSPDDDGADEGSGAVYTHNAPAVAKETVKSLERAELAFRRQLEAKERTIIALTERLERYEGVETSKSIAADMKTAGELRIELRSAREELRATDERAAAAITDLEAMRGEMETVTTELAAKEELLAVAQTGFGRKQKALEERFQEKVRRVVQLEKQEEQLLETVQSRDEDLAALRTQLAEREKDIRDLHQQAEALRSELSSLAGVRKLAEDHGDVQGILRAGQDVQRMERLARELQTAEKRLSDMEKLQDVSHRTFAEKYKVQEQMILERDEQIHQLNSQVNSREAEASDSLAEVDELRVKVRAAGEEAAAKEAQIRRLYTSIETLEERIKEKDSRMVEMERDIQVAKKVYDRLRQCERERDALDKCVRERDSELQTLTKRLFGADESKRQLGMREARARKQVHDLIEEINESESVVLRMLDESLQELSRDTTVEAIEGKGFSVTDEEAAAMFAQRRRDSDASVDVLDNESGSQKNMYRAQDSVLYATGPLDELNRNIDAYDDSASLDLARKRTAESLGFDRKQTADSLGLDRIQTAESLGLDRKQTADSLGFGDDMEDAEASAYDNEEEQGDQYAENEPPRKISHGKAGLSVDSLGMRPYEAEDENEITDYGVENPEITGHALVGTELTLSADITGEHELRWFRSRDGTDLEPVGGSETFYTPTLDDLDAYIVVRIIPVGRAADTSEPTETAVGPVKLDKAMVDLVDKYENEGRADFPVSVGGMRKTLCLRKDHLKLRAEGTRSDVKIKYSRGIRIWFQSDSPLSIALIVESGDHPKITITPHSTYQAMLIMLTVKRFITE